MGVQDLRLTRFWQWDSSPDQTKARQRHKVHFADRGTAAPLQFIQRKIMSVF